MNIFNDQANSRENKIETQDNFPKSHEKEIINADKIVPIIRSNEIITVPHRFNILALLYVYHRIELSHLRKLLNITPGNLDHHIKKLEDNKWVEKVTRFQLRTITLVEITDIGIKIFEQVADEFREIFKELKK